MNKTTEISGYIDVHIIIVNAISLLQYNIYKIILYHWFLL